MGLRRVASHEAQMFNEQQFTKCEERLNLESVFYDGHVQVSLESYVTLRNHQLSQILNVSQCLDVTTGLAGGYDCHLRGEGRGTFYINQFRAFYGMYFTSQSFYSLLDDN